MFSVKSIFTKISIKRKTDFIVFVSLIAVTTISVGAYIILNIRGEIQMQSSDPAGSSKTQQISRVTESDDPSMPDTRTDTEVSDSKENTSVIGSEEHMESFVNKNSEYGQLIGDGTKHFFVSAMKGSDKALGTKTNPFKTISMAVDMMKAGDTAFVGDGTYYESLVLPSGENGRPIKICADTGARPTITTTVKYEGEWTVFKDSIYIADFSEMMNVIDTDYPQLFVNQDSMVEARYPNMGPSMTTIMDYKRAVAQSGTDKDTIITKENLPTDIKGATAIIWPGPNGLCGWFAFKAPVRSVQGNRVNLAVSLNQQEKLLDKNSYTPFEGNAFYIVGALSLLDAPGEYYLDQETNRMYLFMPDGDDPKKHLITLRGTSSTIIYAKDCEYIDLQGLNLYGGGINMMNSNDCKITDCSIKYADHFYGTSWASYQYPHSMVVQGDNNFISKCEFGPTAGDGITIGGDYNTFTNNIVHDCDYSGSDFAGVYVKASRFLKISDCTMYNSSRAHVFFEIFTKSEKCIIENNYFKDHGTLNSDNGPVYTWSCDGGNTEIRHNFIEVGTKNDNGAMWKLRVGLYIDNYSSNFLVHHNIVIGGEFGLATNLPNKNTIFANNTVIGARYGYSLFSVQKDNADGISTGFYNNLFVDIKDTDVYYHGTENGNTVNYIGNFINGEVPVPLNPEKRMDSSNNTRGCVDENFQPINGEPTIDGGIAVNGITDGFTGTAPDIGALELGEPMLHYGANWQLD